MASPNGRTVTRLLAAAALAAALVGCSDEGEPISLPSPTAEASNPTPSAEPSPSASPSDPFAVPDEITADYVERVLNEINRLDAELTRDVLRRPVDEGAQDLPADLEEGLTAIYAEPIVEFNRRALLDLLRSPEQRDDLLPPDEYGQQLARVEEVLISNECIGARIDTDLTETDAEIETARSTLSFVFLTRASQANPSGWKLARSLTSDVVAGSAEEEELRAVTPNELQEQAPEVCQ